MRRHYLGASIPPGAPSSSSFHMASPGGSSMTIACGHAWKSPPNRPCHGYKIDGEGSHTAHTTTQEASLPPLVSFYLLVVLLELDKKLCWRARTSRRNLCMINMKSSSMFFFLSYQYNYVMKLEKNSYVIHLAYKTLCLILDTTYMFRPRPKLRWWVLL
jgi:hypothetical protein